MTSYPRVRYRRRDPRGTEVADLERTFLDAVDRLDLCGGIEEVVRGVARRHRDVDRERLLRYVVEFDAPVVTKRLGFLLEIVGHGDARLPYRIRIRAELLECVPMRWVKASVAGDLVGDATLALSRTVSGTEVVVRWRVEMMQGSMRTAARVAYPLMRWGHDPVVEHSVEGFRRHLQTELP